LLASIFRGLGLSFCGWLVGMVGMVGVFICLLVFGLGWIEVDTAAT
jgi:hypothetical protein